MGLGHFWIWVNLYIFDGYLAWIWTILAYFWKSSALIWAILGLFFGILGLDLGRFWPIWSFQGLDLRGMGPWFVRCMGPGFGNFRPFLGVRAWNWDISGLFCGMGTEFRPYWPIWGEGQSIWLFWLIWEFGARIWPFLAYFGTLGHFWLTWKVRTWLFAPPENSW